ncbi:MULTISPECIES: ABC transporter ATP-binding protein [unclassified Rhodococcus (in: high G+C Gram-positive bacteria)]|uniref:ABC transporter ATP-binding protein n=1 Tax=unclassified Rhodococcus (in: high G+C Gram-positive bacteria) TaxID=192944 RepID=UPI000B9BB6C6|nr:MULTISPECIES: ABC transporter ATP-binding protein [unclassified Rhodococcus (in: high G+C Gram-positive bacteria)]OZE38385.1 iron ABC transporter ATP-binding protein [Rhodococcus sp. 05-2254-4]OZE47152.1 iron ABC transporter ATP-binding protein [Rhodococcus sp. 05-2254-3]OZE54855.1 iron ABC transporter ATP-binding protein [Rhodococcus sp. 05-2254-2]
MSMVISGLVASYGSTAVLHGIDLDLGDGEMLAVLGPSGCGKTTLLRSIAGLHRIDAGRITSDGRDISVAGQIQVPPEKRGIGLMPQEGGLFPHLTVRRNIEFGLRAGFLRPYLSGRDERARRVDEMLELVGLPDSGGVKPSELSGGQQQRIALARALAPAPSVVLMDEPFAALDAGLRTSIRQDVRELLQSSKTASILVTHDRAEALGTADRVAVLLGGRCAQIDTPREVYERPATPAVARFVGDAYFVDAVARGGHVDTVLGRLESTTRATGNGQALLRPEQLVVSERKDGAFFVEHEFFTGPESSVTLRHYDTGLRLRAIARTADRFAPGTAVEVSVMSPVHWFPRQVS